MKKFITTLITFFACITLLNVGCTKSDSNDDEGNAPLSGGCDLGDPTASKVTSYGTFAAGIDMCTSTDGLNTTWTGMSDNIAHIFVSTTSFNGGVACGACYKIKGPVATKIARVVGYCSGCAGIDMDDTAFNEITGASSSGMYDVTMTPIACPIATQGIRYTSSGASNSFYLNISPANYKYPIEKIELNDGTGFITMTRDPNTNEHSYSAIAALPTIVQVRATDIFDQKITSAIDSTANATTLTTQQFGNCK